MSDIHQEWHELRKKNGDFISHLDGEMAKLDKQKQMQDLIDAGAFAMQFVVPQSFNCCADDRDILKALNKAQADRIKQLEEELRAYKRQHEVDLEAQKDLDEKLDKTTANYRTLFVEHEDLKRQLAYEQAQSDEKGKNAARCYAALANERNHLVKKISKMDETIRNLTEINHGMQSKIARQANEIKRLTKENLDLKNAIALAQKSMEAYGEELHTLRDENHQLSNALDLAAKDADKNFKRGKVKGMQEIWDALQNVYSNHTLGENQKVFGYNTVGDILENLSPTWFINRVKEYYDKEKQQEKDIQIGDEVEVFEDFITTNDDEHSDLAIVVARDLERNTFEVFGRRVAGCFDANDIQNGIVRKTGRHFDTIPLDYFA